MCLWNRILGVSGKRNWEFLECPEKALGILAVFGERTGNSGTVQRVSTFGSVWKERWSCWGRALRTAAVHCPAWLLKWANGGLLHISILTCVIYLFTIQHSYSAIHVFITTDIFAGGFNYSNCFHHSLIGMKQDWSRLFKFLKNMFLLQFFYGCSIGVAFNNLLDLSLVIN